jgi:hypothetical protein
MYLITPSSGPFVTIPETVMVCPTIERASAIFFWAKQKLAIATKKINENIHFINTLIFN